MVATDGLLLTQVPPVLGVALIVDPTHTFEGTITVGRSFTVTTEVVLLHPVAVEVNVKETVPAPTAVTKPLLSTVATFVSSLVQVPPALGAIFIVDPTCN
jgi:hypothetical protein